MGSVVSGVADLEAESEDELIRKAETPGRDAHGIQEIAPQLVEQVRATFAMSPSDAERPAGGSMAASPRTPDFGTGYSSLSYLGHPLDALKLDRSFLAGLHDERTEAIVRAIMAIATALRIDVIGEGIETEEQAERLHRWDA